MFSGGIILFLLSFGAAAGLSFLATHTWFKRKLTKVSVALYGAFFLACFVYLGMIFARVGVLSSGIVILPIDFYITFLSGIGGAYFFREGLKFGKG